MKPEGESIRKDRNRAIPLLWSFIETKIAEGQALVLLCVLESQGSSPGRQGFKMVLSSDGEMAGSIGGGIMEQKLITLAQNFLATGQRQGIIKRQIHRKDSATNQSGMICSGEQVVYLHPIQTKEIPDIKAIISEHKKDLTGYLQFNPQGLSYLKSQQERRISTFHFQNENNWQYIEALDQRPVVYIVGAGHVGLAFSKTMNQLDFYVKILDDRPGLNTLENNTTANEKIVVDYQNIGAHIPANEQHFVVIMTFGYRSDKLVLKQLLGRSFAYVGMMGSEAKIAQLFEELRQEGVEEEQLRSIYAPIGLNIFSKTPAEIAVSIAAEIIEIKNKNLPTGRMQKT